MKTFIWTVKQFGLKLALDNLFIGLLKKWLGAKRVQISYWRKK